MGTIDGCPFEVQEEDLLRAQLYALLGRLLAQPPEKDVLELVTGLEGDDTPLGQALTELAEIGAKTTLEKAEDEYNALFIGVTRGELVPYASYYLTGFLHERPLADLREDMGRLGIERPDEVKEPEDHIAALCEMMRGLLTGVFGQAAAVWPEQRALLRRPSRHMGAEILRGSAEVAEGSKSSMHPSAGSASTFMSIEAEAFELAA